MAGVKARFYQTDAAGYRVCGVSHPLQKALAVGDFFLLQVSGEFVVNAGNTTATTAGDFLTPVSTAGRAGTNTTTKLETCPVEITITDAVVAVDDDLFCRFLREV